MGNAEIHTFMGGLFVSAALNSEFDLATVLHRPFTNAEPTDLNNG